MPSSYSPKLQVLKVDPYDYAEVERVSVPASELPSVGELLCCEGALPAKSLTLGSMLALNVSHSYAAECLGKQGFDINIFMAQLDHTYGQAADLHLMTWLTKLPVFIRRRQHFYYQRTLALIVCAIHEGDPHLPAHDLRLFDQYITNQLNLSGIWFDVGVYLNRCWSPSSKHHHDYLRYIYKPQLFYLLFKEMLGQLVKNTAKDLALICAMAEMLVHFDLHLIWQRIKQKLQKRFGSICVMTGYLPELVVRVKLLANKPHFPFLEDCKSVLQKNAGEYYAASRYRLRPAGVDTQDLYELKSRHPCMQHLFDKDYGLINYPPQTLSAF